MSAVVLLAALDAGVALVFWVISMADPDTFWRDHWPRKLWKVTVLSVCWPAVFCGCFAAWEE